MKNIKYFFSIAILAITFLFNSCTGDVEPLDPALTNQLEVSPDCTIPTNLQTIRLSAGTSINLSWEATGTATSWEVEYGLKDYVQGAGTKIKVNNTSVTITNLFATNSYDFYVRSVCGENSFGEWTAVATNIGANPNCANPTEVTAARSTTNTAEVIVNWAAPSTQSSWEIKYGATGFDVNTGTNSLLTTTKPKTITGLATTSYDFYVRAKCTATENSNWVGPINVAASTIINPVGDDYWPFALNNKWAFKKNGILQSAMKIISLDPIAGNNYFTFENFFANPNIGAGVVATVRGRKVGTDYYYRYQTSGSIIIEPLEVIILKSALAVNETWIQNVTQIATIPGLPNPVSSQVTFTGKIIEKGISIDVNGVNYTNVIKSELIQNSGGIINTNTYWFAKGIGPIKIINVTGSDTTTQELDSYMLN